VWRSWWWLERVVVADPELEAVVDPELVVAVVLKLVAELVAAAAPELAAVARPGGSGGLEPDSCMGLEACSGTGDRCGPYASLMVVVVLELAAALDSDDSDLVDRHRAGAPAWMGRAVVATTAGSARARAAGRIY
jgi:hypothetical protein